MPNTDLDKSMVYFAYRDIFKGNLARLRKQNKIRRVVRAHKDKALAVPYDTNKICRILGVLLAARWFEPESLGNTARLIKSEEGERKENGRSEGENRHTDRTNFDAPLLPDTRSPDHLMLIGESQPEHRVKSRHIKKRTKAARRLEAILGEAEKVIPKEFLHQERGRTKFPRTRDCDIILPNPTYLPFRLQHAILTQTQQLLEECCYYFTKKWFPSILEAHSWDTSEAVELTDWWETLSKRQVPVAAMDLSQGQPLAVLFKRVKYIRHSAVHRDPQMPIKRVEEMVRDAWLLSQALRDDLRAAQIGRWHKELESLVAQLRSRTNTQRGAAEVELWELHKEKVELEERLAQVESKVNQLTQSLEVEGKTRQIFDIEELRPLEMALNSPALAKALTVYAQDQPWHSIHSEPGMVVDADTVGQPQRSTLREQLPTDDDESTDYGSVPSDYDWG
ncbi:hypothetical protein BJ875DRAFT_122408 [Amylocarpus encephaloides]|uniref:Uncharacterized protein n=1 Tax=Amylocarpus encephaloides TaxID=45428 RepID=A0A9P7YCX6_9HELO|nr:hypothetical protein BJ875DRAFT_122408 [Amylocarpus encephaloides]